MGQYFTIVLRNAKTGEEKAGEYVTGWAHYGTGEPKRLKDLKKGEFFTLKDYGDDPDPARVYIRGEYDRAERKYEVTKFDDFNDFRFMKGERLVYTGFTF